MDSELDMGAWTWHVNLTCESFRFWTFCAFERMTNIFDIATYEYMKQKKRDNARTGCL